MVQCKGSVCRFGSRQTQAGSLAESLTGLGKAGTSLSLRILFFRDYPDTEGGTASGTEWGLIGLV